MGQKGDGAKELIRNPAISAGEMPRTETVPQS